MAFWSENFDGSSIKDPKRKFRFIVSFSALNTTEGGPYLWMAKTAGKPSFTISETSYEYFNHKFYYPGRTDWETVDIVVVDPGNEGSEMAANFSQIVNNAGYNPPSSAIDLVSMSKKSAVTSLGTVLISQVDAEGAPVETWTLWNVFIISVKYGDLDYSSDDLNEITITLRYDWARLETVEDSRVTTASATSGTASGKSFFTP
jgi:hypothetical protein